MRTKSSVFVVCFLLITTSLLHSQVRKISDVKLPESMLRKFPFITDQFYAIKSPDSTGFLGYFMFRLDKKALHAFLEKKVRDTTVYLLTQKKFFQTSCRIGYNNCGDTYTDFDRFNFTGGAQRQSMLQNKVIQHVSNYQLGARKTNMYRTRVQEYGWWTCKRKKDRDNVNLFSTRIESSVQFSYDEPRSCIILDFQAAAAVNILFSGCQNSIFTVTSPYHQRRVVKLNARSPIAINLSELQEASELFRLLLENTKRIRVTQDNQFYYVYCIRETVKTAIASTTPGRGLYQQ